MKLLNVGCGLTYHKDWINIDFVAIKEDVKQVDIKKGLPYPDETFDAVYSSHVLEHFNKTEGEQLLREMYRVLKPQGIIRIVVPDLGEIIETYKDITTNLDESNELDVFKHEWMLMELYDQTVRNVSGGEMGRFMSTIDGNSHFIFERVGYEMFFKEERQFLIDKVEFLSKKSNIYIFGSGSAGQRIQMALQRIGIQIQGFIDNSVNKIGSIIQNVNVYSLNEVSKESYIIIASTWWKDIKSQLIKYEYKNFDVIEYIESKEAVQKEIDVKIENIRKYIELELGKEYVTVFNEAIFRNNGEIHKRMFDSYLLKRVLLKTSFNNVERKNAFESNIYNFKSYALDTVGNEVRKPYSLFMEARK